MEGNIYKVVNTVDDMIYIGSTKTRLSDRMGGHRARARNTSYRSKFYKHMRKVGIQKFQSD